MHWFAVAHADFTPAELFLTITVLLFRFVVFLVFVFIISVFGVTGVMLQIGWMMVE